MSASPAQAGAAQPQQGPLRIARLLLTGSLYLLATWSLQAVAAPDAEPWALWDRSDEQRQDAIDHSAWQTLLDTYVVTLPDARTAFRYRDVTPTHRRLLTQYLGQLAALDPRRYNRDTQMAYWINLYNALTVKVVLDNPKKKSILRMGGGWLPRGPWDDEVITVAAQPLTLNDIEHRILRPIWQDHRIHFAVNCASVGCPNLAPQAFTAAQLEQQLQSAERTFLGHPRALSLTGKGLELSSIFDWYMVDFGADRDALLRYLSKATQRPELSGYEGDLDFHYDWALNSAP